jgi:hypothetical protein
VRLDGKAMKKAQIENATIVLPPYLQFGKRHKIVKKWSDLFISIITFLLLGLGRRCGRLFSKLLIILLKKLAVQGEE